MAQSEFVEITTPIGSEDFALLAGIVNVGIDSHLEGFTRSEFGEITDHEPARRYRFNFHRSEMPILKRRLSEVGTEAADMWGVDLFGDDYFLS